MGFTIDGFAALAAHAKSAPRAQRREVRTALMGLIADEGKKSQVMTRTVEIGSCDQQLAGTRELAFNTWQLLRRYRYQLPNIF